MQHGDVLLTGALGGLGSAIALALLAQGHRLVCCDRRADEAAAWLEQFSSDERERIEFHGLDVRDLDQVGQLRERLEARGVHIAYLINNAGIANAGAPWEMEARAFDRVIQVNLYGSFNLTRTFCAAMREAGFGRIINFASLAAFEPGAGMASYAAAKAGIIGYTHSIASDLAAHGVTANVIAPGLIWHERLRPTYSDAERATFLEGIPMQREGAPRELSLIHI